jgi:EAL domain-containing protein (putative c-di-GMP-specific phosphodiesterase class I)
MFVYRLVRFRYLTAVLIALALLASLAFAMTIGWRNVYNELQGSASRAVFNADRLLDRTVADLSKLDSLRSLPCDASTTRLLQEAVYNSLSQIREVGLVRDGRLYCTNFGPTVKEIPVPTHLLEPGTHIDVAPNSVMPNNTSLYVYVSRERGSAVDALFNPQVLAEFERDFEYTGYGRLSLEVKASARQSAQKTASSNTVYTVGELRAADASAAAFTHRKESSRSDFVAHVEVSPRALWNETLALLPLMLAVFGVAALVAIWAIRRWLANGNLDRLRYMGALHRREFVMHYQPIVEAKTLKMVGVEALLRWQHPRRGLLRAAQFVDIFAHDALVAPLAKRVIELVSKDMQTVPLESKLWCTMNIAPTLLEDNAVFNALSEQILKSGSNRIQIEITERAPLGEYAEVLLHEMRANGIKVGMDDLGTGYANLSQLQRMPFDFIKIDGVLVRNIQAIDGASPVVKSLIDLALDIGAEIIVEGVETKVQADALIKCGVTHLQGFYFDAARPIEEIVEALRRQ